MSESECRITEGICLSAHRPLWSRHDNTLSHPSDVKEIDRTTGSNHPSTSVTGTLAKSAALTQ